MSERDTIAAIATPAGRGGIGVVKVSGPAVTTVAKRVVGTLPKPRYATYANFKDQDGQVIDSGIAIYFPSPHSFTGEDILELHGHGGPVVMNMLLNRCLACGARLANPGEFSERAFHNGKLDLAQAEAVADLIDSSTEQAVRSAHRSLQGLFSQVVYELVEELIGLRTYVEAAIDFPEEEIDFLSDTRVVHNLDQIIDRTNDLMSSTKQGCLLREGLHVVLAGRPNAGKSSLLNALAQHDRAIVDAAPGTTRDTIELQIQLDGMPVHLVDTAGLRDARDAVESEGVRRTYAALENADHILFIVDDCEPQVKDNVFIPPNQMPCTYVFNKIDLTGRDSGSFSYGRYDALAISAKYGQGLGELREHLKQVAGFQDADGSTFIARSRHLNAIREALEHLVMGRQQLVEANAGELLAEELRLAQRHFSEITGVFTSDQLLDRIFSSFCIGK